MDRELLLEIGVEELPASWLPGLTLQLADRVREAPGRASSEISWHSRDVLNAETLDGCCC